MINVMYVNFINNARKATAIIMAICGACHVICSYRVDELTWASGYVGSAIWLWGVSISAIGVLACLVATLAFVIEYLARPIAPRLIKLRSLIFQFLLITIVIAAIWYAMLIAFGPWQGIGAVTGVFMLLAAIKKGQAARPVFAVLAAIFLGLTLLSTQSAYQYARRHSEEILAAGCALMDQWPEAQEFKESKIDDPNVPKVLRRLGAKKILVDKEHVCIFTSQFTDAEFQIFREPTTTLEPVWMSRSKGAGTFEITDKLWMFVND